MNTALFSDINWLAVLVAAVAYFAIGGLWYSKVLFANSWVRLSGVNMNDPNAKKGAAQIMLASFVLMIVACIGLAILIARIGSSGWMTGCKTGLITGICFSATAISISYLYEKKPTGLHLINGLYNIIGSVVAGSIIAAWPK
ncbi:MAG: DUF1761 domain-containing protein [Bacteroidota bacterium]|nr:DUF1761 domain-containing protein [Bacteroidota bacterium]